MLAMVGTSPVETNARGENKKNPLWTLKLEYFRERRAQHEKFGMTPSSRARLTVTDAKLADPLEAALGMPAPPPPTSPDEDADLWSAEH